MNEWRKSREREGGGVGVYGRSLHSRTLLSLSSLRSLRFSLSLLSWGDVSLSIWRSIGNSQSTRGQTGWEREGMVSDRTIEREYNSPPPPSLPLSLSIPRSPLTSNSTSTNIQDRVTHWLSLKENRVLSSFSSFFPLLQTEWFHPFHPWILYAEFDSFSQLSHSSSSPSSPFPLPSPPLSSLPLPSLSMP